MTRIRVLIVVAAVCTLGTLATFAQGPARSKTQVLVLRGGLLIDGTGATPLNNAVVMISDGRIQRVGAAGVAPIPPDALVIDTTGKTIMPGLVDGHMHMRNYQASTYLYWGVTTVGDLGDPPGHLLAYRAAVDNGRTAGPHIMATGAKLNAPLDADGGEGGERATGFESFLSGNNGEMIVNDEASLERAISAAKAAGLDAIKLYTRMDVPLLTLGARVAHRHGFPAFVHQNLAMGTDEVLDTGIDMEVHLYGLLPAATPPDVRERLIRGERIQPYHLLDTSKFPPITRRMAERKIFYNPTIGKVFRAVGSHREALHRLNTAFLEGPVLRDVPADVRARFATTFADGPGKRAQELEEGFRRVSVFVKQFVDQGGKIVAGTDAGAGVGLVTAGLLVHEEMQFLRDAGLTPMQTIQAATSWTMEAWGKGKEVGTLETGKRADVLILNQNPLTDIAATTDIYKVIQAGNVIDREGLATWRETIPKTTPVSGDYVNRLLRIPLIHEITPELVPMSAKRMPELRIRGTQLSDQSLVLLNDRLLPVKMYGPEEIGVALPAALLKKPGVYPLAVVQPGSAGGVSNLFYFTVTPD